MTVSGSGGTPVQVRAARRDGWTKAKRTAFLEVLGASCNIRRAAAAVGMTDGTARALRRRDAEFARLWDEALADGYERLETSLVAQALGTAADAPVRAGAGPDAIPSDNPSREEIGTLPLDTPFDPTLAIKVLSMRTIGPAASKRRRPSGARMSDALVEAALLRKLNAIEARLRSADRKGVADGTGSDAARPVAAVALIGGGQEHG